MFRGMRVGAHGNNLTSEIMVARDDLFRRIRVSKAVFETTGIDFNPFSHGDQSAQYFVNDIGTLRPS